MLSHKHQTFVTARSGALTEPTAHSAGRAKRFWLEIEKQETAAAASDAQCDTVVRGTRATGVTSDGPVFVECREPDRREGPRVGSREFPRGVAKAGLCRPLRPEGAG